MITEYGIIEWQIKLFADINTVFGKKDCQSNPWCNTHTYTSNILAREYLFKINVLTKQALNVGEMVNP